MASLVEYVKCADTIDGDHMLKVGWRRFFDIVGNAYEMAADERR